MKLRLRKALPLVTLALTAILFLETEVVEPRVRSRFCPIPGMSLPVSMNRKQFRYGLQQQSWLRQKPLNASLAHRASRS